MPISPSKRLLVALGLALAPDSVLGGESPIPSRLQPFVDRGVLAGAVTLVASPDEVLDLQAVGFADVAARSPMKPDSLFWIASMSKPMTATALMMLVDEGEIALDDPVEKYLPEFRGQMVASEASADRVVLVRPKHPITVREVLSHTSGQPFSSRVQSKIDQFPLRVSVLTDALTPLKFEPGTKYDYSNAGINAAGRIVEVVSGQPFEDFLQARLLDPLGMKDTTFWPTAEQVGRIAKSYRPASKGGGLEEIPIEQLTYPLTDRSRGACPAGGLFSSAEDMGKFGRMILNGGTLDGRRYLFENAVSEMTSTQTGTLLNGGKGEGGYGLGWTTSSQKIAQGPIPPGPCGHGGAYATDLALDPERKLVMVFLVQHAGYPNNEGSKILPAFRKAAEAAFGK